MPSVRLTVSLAASLGRGALLSLAAEPGTTLGALGAGAPRSAVKRSLSESDRPLDRASEQSPRALDGRVDGQWTTRKRPASPRGRRADAEHGRYVYCDVSAGQAPVSLPNFTML